MPAAVPAAILSGPQSALLGETAQISVTFDNTGADPGYGPYVDLFLDTNGPDGAVGAPNDGFDVSQFSASYLGQPLPFVRLVTIGAGNQYVHPLTGQTFTAPGSFQPGDMVAVLQLPFGSFTGPQPQAAITVTVGTSNLADVGTPLPIAAQAGFLFGDTPTGANGPLRQNTAVASSVTPELFRLTKTYIGPEDETATGPNYKRRYRLDVDIATGQSIRNLSITDLLGGSLQWTGASGVVQRIQGNAIAANLTGTTATATIPGGNLVANFGNVTGIAGVDASLDFEFFVPRDRNTGAAVLPQGTTAGSGTYLVTENNTGRADGLWTPLDPRDPANQAVSSVLPANAHVLQEQSVAVQKTVTAVDRTTLASTGGVIIPGQTLLRYDIDFQVSDYYAFQNVILQDVLSDGQRLFVRSTGLSTAPTLQVSNAYNGATNARGTSAAAAFAAAGSILYESQFTTRGTALSDPTTTPSGAPFQSVAVGTILPSNSDIDGETVLQFNISQELSARGFTGGRLVGGAIPNGGGTPSASGDDPPYSPLFGPTTGRIVFYAEVKDEFSDDFPSGDRSVDSGDVLGNSVPAIRGDQLNAQNLTTVIGVGSDDSGAGVVLPFGGRSKTIYAINGTVLPPPGANDPPLTVQAGDRLTYRLTSTLPISSFESLRLIDFPPLPVFPVGAAGLYNLNLSAAPTFAAYEIARGPSDDVTGVAGGYFSTFGVGGGRTPTLSTDAAANAITLDFGTFDDIPGRRSTTIDVLLTLPVGADPFAADLFLTNQLRVANGSTNAGSQAADAIRRFELVRPTVQVSKGVAGYNATGLSFTAGAETITFAAPTSGSSFTVTGGTGTIDSAADAAAIGASNLSNLTDAGDTVRYAIVVRNSGRGDAYDVTVADQIQNGFIIPANAAGLNLVVRRGDGQLLSAGTDYTVAFNNATGAFSVTLIDNFNNFGTPAYQTAANLPTLDNRTGGLSRGAATGAAITDGSNTVVITYDLVHSANAPTVATIVNTARVTNYASSEGGGDLTDPTVVPGATEPTDTATVTIAPGITKSLVSTSIVNSSNSNTQAVIGELVTYRITLTAPEGVTSGVRVVDTLDAGLAFVGNVSALTYSNPGEVSATLAATPTVSNQGGTIRFDLGTITNNNRANGTAETISFTYQAVVLNVAGNQGGTQLDNLARVDWDGGSTSTVSAAPVAVIEPVLDTAKSVVVNGAGTTGDAGDPIVYTITLRHTAASATDAFDVTFNDPLPTGTGGVSLISGPTFTVVDTAGLVTAADFELVGSDAAGWTLRTPAGTSFDLPLAPAGRTITLTVSGTLASAVAPGSTFTNTATANWSSLDGVPGQISTHNTNSTERTGSGGVNDYTDPGAATTTVIGLAPTKSLIATSEASTGVVGGVTEVAIGEVVRYRLAVRLAESTATNFVLRDNLPTGLRFLNDSTAMVAFVANGVGQGITSTAVAGGQVVGSSSAVTPTFALPDAAVSSSASSNVDNYTSGADVFFRLGDVVNLDRDGDQEFVVIEFNAVVENVASNVAGTNRDNNFNVLINGATVGAASNSIRVRVAEPSITNVDKSANVTTGDAGDTITYTVTYSNTGSASAFDVNLTDSLPSGLTLVGTPAVTLGGGAAGVKDDSTASKLDVTIGTVPINGTVSIVYQALVPNTVEPRQVITNTANVTYSGLPGPSGSAGNPTGSTTPGAAGSATGERNGDGGINNYTDSDTASFTIADPAISKTTISTSVAATGTGEVGSPTVEDLVIGETVTFLLTVTLSEGLTAPLTIIDNLPTSNGILGVVSSRVVSIGSSITGAGLAVGAAGTAADVNLVDGFNDRVTFSFGNVTNVADNVADAGDQIVVEVVARVENVAANAAGDTLRNTGILQFGAGNVLTSTADVDIVEPVLRIQKSASDITPEAGAIVTYTLSVTNLRANGSTAPAFDITVLDALTDPNLTFLPGTVTSTAGTITIGNGAGDTSLRVNLATLLLDETVTITYQAQLAASLPGGALVRNTASLGYDSLPGPGGRAGTDSSSEYLGVPGLAKTVTSTSLAQTGASQFDPTVVDVAIGELVTYQLVLTVPQGSSTPVSLVDNLPTGAGILGLVSSRVVSIGANISGSLLAVNDSGIAEDVNLPDGIDDRVSFDFGNLTNTNTGVLGAGDRIIVEIVARVEDVAANAAGDLLRNVAALSVGSTVLTASADVEVVEPALDVQKSVDRNTGDAGDLLTYTVVLSHLPGATGPAYDVALADLLAPGLQLVAGSVRVNGNPTFSLGSITTGNTAGDTTVRIDLPVYDLNDGTLTITYQARITGAAAPGATLTNTAGVNWDSKPGTGGRPGSDSDPADVQVNRSRLAGYVYRDLNNNGLRDDGATGLGGIAVTLTGSDIAGNSFNLTVFTNPDGSYQFADLRPGDYVITEGATPGLLDGRDTIGSQNGSAADDQFSISIPRGSNLDGVENNFGELPPASLAGFVYQDDNNNGVRDPGELGIVGAAVRLTGTDDRGNSVDLLFAGGTLADGSYSFANLRPGTYTIKETQPFGYFDGRDTIGSQNGTVGDDVFTAIGLQAGVNGVDNNFGEWLPGVISGFVYVDSDNDGQFDLGERPIAGARVTLTGRDLFGNPVNLTTLTLADGSYRFAGLRPGDYTLVETQPVGYLDGRDTLGSAGGTLGNDRISSIRLGIGVNSERNNFGELRPSTLSGRVWIDRNNNGRREANEPFLRGVVVTLVGTDDLGNTVRRTLVTDATGSYRFTNLRPGVYSVTRTIPLGQRAGYSVYGSQNQMGRLTTGALRGIVLGPAGVDAILYNFALIPVASKSWLIR